MQKTTLSKIYDCQAVEQKWKEYWEKEKIFQFQYDPQKPLYIVDTPPPYVSAEHLHSGHIMSYAQAEFIVRYKRMRGFNVFYPMGFDNNGLPTERFVEKKYQIDKSKISKSEFIKLCLKETEIGSQTYKKLWNDLGISVDWTKTYSTISPLATKVSQCSLIDLYKKNALYRKEEPVLWCPFCQTAVAQADLEDKECEAKLNYVKFKSSKGEDLTIATTRPELIPACVAFYVHPQDKKSKHLIDQKAIVPLFDYQVPIKTSEAIDMEFGTGRAMTCTWGDQEDLEKWRTDKLKTRAIVNQDGTLNELAGQYQGSKLEEARQKIITDLEEAGHLVKQENITHTVNVHERCGTPIEFILSKQWFIKITDMADVWLKYGRELNWYPQARARDYEMWVDSLKWDWCISRQRYYGVPIPVWYCKKCDEPIFADEASLPVNPSEDKPSISQCPKCQSQEFIPETDVMDTWATSSCTPFLLRELVDDDKVKQKLFPTTLRPNAFEIIRTWDFYSIVKSHYHFNQLPFTDIMISGHGLDEQGRKISKRLGNYIPSDQLLEKYGADAIRYWATGATLGQNLRFNPQEINKGKRTTIKLWNATRFLNMNLEDFNDDDINNYSLEAADVWILSELNKTIEVVTKAFDDYTYAKARDEIDNFFWSKFADYYVEFVKYRLTDRDQTSRKATQATLAIVFLAIIKMYAPILPFITEEIYQKIGGWKNGARKSIHLSSWPKAIKLQTDLDISDFDTAITAIDEIRKDKSDKGISLGAGLKEYKLQAEIDLKKYGEFIKDVMRVEKLS